MLKVLNGVKVLEQGTFITGPCAAMMLADLGADVIKLESPGTGDPYRNFRGGYYSAHFQAYNRNKRAMGVDLKSEGDRAIFYDLIRNADIYIQNFRPGAAGRMGADYETLKAINPRLVLLLDLRLRPDRPLCRAAQLRLGDPGPVGLPRRRHRPGSAAHPRSGHGRRHHRSVCRPGRAGGPGGAGLDGAGAASGSVHARGHDALRRGALHWLLRARRNPQRHRPPAPGSGLHPAHQGRPADRPAPVLDREVLDQSGGGAGRRGPARRSPLRHTAGAHRRLSHPGRGAERHLRP